MLQFASPKSVREALNLLKQARGKARIISGGTNMIPEMRVHTFLPRRLIDISRLKNLIYIKEERRKIRIGGLTPIFELISSSVLQLYAPILCQTARQLGNPQIRNRATLAGNLADASPAADMAVPLLVLEAAVVAARAGRKDRAIPIQEFFLGPNKTTLQRDELIREIIFPKPGSAARMGYFKLGLRNAMAISVCSAALLAEFEGETCRKVRIALGAAAPVPMRACETEKILEAKEWRPEVLEAACARAAQEISPIADIRATADYRRSMASVLLRRLCEQVSRGER